VAARQAKGGGAVAGGLREGLPPLLFLAGVFFLTFLSRIVLAPLAPLMEAEMGFSHAQAGSLFLFISLGYFPSLLCSGFISARLGHRRAIAGAALAAGLALGAAAGAQGLWGLRAGGFFLGLATGIYLPSGLATLTSLVRAEHWGKALAVHELAPNLGFVLAPLAVEFLLAWFSWRGVLGLLGVACLLAGLGFYWRGPGAGLKGQAPSLGNLRELLAGRSFWIMLLLFSLGIGGSLGVYSMLPLFLLSERGLHQQEANLLIAVSRLAGVGAAFVAGWATDRLGPRRALAGVLAASGALTLLLGLAQGLWLVVCLFAQPLLAVCFFPAGFAALARLGSPAARAVAVSLTVPLAYILGGGALPAMIGWLGEYLSFAWGLGLAGAVTVLSLGLLPLLRLSPKS
jgi:NNP family nitrate/nitrite transporter-like MFS transporter